MRRVLKSGCRTIVKVPEPGTGIVEGALRGIPELDGRVRTWKAVVVVIAGEGWKNLYKPADAVRAGAARIDDQLYHVNACVRVGKCKAEELV